MAIPYNLAIHISMTNGVSPVLALIAKDMLGLNMSAEKLEKTLNRVGSSLKLMLGGAAAMVGGFELLKGLEHVADKGEELIHQQNVMLRNGVSYNDVLKVTKTAFDNITKAVPTATAADVLRTVNELRSVTGTMEKAMAMTETSLKIEGLISNATKKSAEGQGYNIWRAAEDKGIIQDKALTDRMIGLMTQAITATGGKITGSDFFSYARRAKSAWIGDAPEAMAEQVMQMQTSGADTAGVERRMFHRMINGGQKLSKMQSAEWERVGLLPADGKILGRDTEQSRPDNFIKGVVEQLEAKGITGQAATQAWADKALNASSSHYFMVGYTGIRNPEGETGLTRLEKEQINLDQAQGLVRAYETMLKGGAPIGATTPRGIEDPQQAAARAKGESGGPGADYGANMKALTTQWNSLMEAVGGPVARAAIPVLQSMTSAFNSLGSIANAHPEAIKVIAEALGVLGVAMIAIGGAAVLAGAALLLPGGAITMAVVGLATMFASFAAFHPETVMKILHTDLLALFTKEFSALAAKCGPVISNMASGLASAIGTGLASIPGLLGSAISSMASGIAGAIGSALSGIAAKIGGVFSHGGGPTAPINGEANVFPGAYHPPSGKTGSAAGQNVMNDRPIVVHSVVALNERELGRAVSTSAANHHRYSGQAPSTDWSRHFDSGDANYMTG